MVNFSRGKFMAQLFTQDGRFLKMTTPLPEGTFLLTHFNGIETLSHTFHFNLKVISYNKEITADQLLKQPVTVTLQEDASDEPRYFNGVVTRFHVGEIHSDICNYEIEIAPWFYLLNYMSDCRVFQSESVVDIAEAIFA